MGALRATLSPERAIDVLWLLNGPDVYQQLVRRAGWSVQEYETWLSDAMVGELLDR